MARNQPLEEGKIYDDRARRLYSLTEREEDNPGANALLGDLGKPTSKQAREDTSGDLRGLSWLTERDALLITLEAQGKTESEIAKQLGIAQSTAHDALARAHLCHYCVRDSDEGPSHIVVMLICCLMGVEHPEKKEVLSSLIFRVISSSIDDAHLYEEWDQYDDLSLKEYIRVVQNQRPARSRLRQAVEAMQASPIEYIRSLGELVSSHIRDPRPNDYQAAPYNFADDSFSNPNYVWVDYGPLHANLYWVACNWCADDVDDDGVADWAAIRADYERRRDKFCQQLADSAPTLPRKENVIQQVRSFLDAWRAGVLGPKHWEAAHKRSASG